MNNYTRTALDAIAEALNAGKYDVITVTVVIVSIVLLFIVISTIVRVRNKQRIRKSAEAGYQRLIRKYNFTILELDLISLMAETLRKPEKKYLLLVNKGTFHQAVRKLGELSKEETSLLSLIEEKTGFSGELDQKNYFSTSSLSRGLPVYLELESKDVYQAEIYSVSEADIMIKIFGNSSILDVDEKLSLYAFAPGGLKTYTLKIVKSKLELFSARHAEEEEPARRKISLEVNIRSEHEDQEGDWKSVILLLTNDGAVIQNPSNSLKQGDDIRIFPIHDTKKIIHINAEVEKVSSVKKLCFVKFTHESNSQTVDHNA
ncbi:MAG: hypothetical protein JEZ04_16555 [Spirochaetales bacterium]|nr:hypothetical protein [Spirochaetales bacterium]